MPKKRFFTKNHERVGKKSGKPRGKYKKKGQIEEIILQQTQIQPQISTQVLLKKQDKQNKLPNILRKITEGIPQFPFSPTTIALMVFLAVLGVVSLWQLIGLVQKSTSLHAVITQRTSLMDQMNSWGNIASKYPGYRDAYLQAAILAYRLGDREKEKQYLDKALQIDPNYEPAKKLMEL